MTWNKAAIRKGLQVVVEDNIWLSAYINDVQMSNCLHIFFDRWFVWLKDYADLSIFFYINANLLE